MRGPFTPTTSLTLLVPPPRCLSGLARQGVGGWEDRGRVPTPVSTKKVGGFGGWPLLLWGFSPQNRLLSPPSSYSRACVLLVCGRLLHTHTHIPPPSSLVNARAAPHPHARRLPHRGPRGAARGRCPRCALPHRRIELQNVSCGVGGGCGRRGQDSNTHPPSSFLPRPHRLSSFESRPAHRSGQRGRPQLVCES